MIIDASVIEGGVIPPLLDKLINIHERGKPRFDRLRRYYTGEHDIMDRERLSSGTANTRVVCNHAKYITDIVQSFLVGNPVTYSASAECDIEALKDEYFKQDIAAVDANIVKSMSIYGRAYELIYSDGTAAARSTVIDPRNAFVVYDNTALETPLFAVNYYKRFDLEGNCKGVVCYVYDRDTVTLYEGKADSWASMSETEKRSHYFGEIPLIEYRNNDECQGDFEQLIPLIDAYNTLQSDRVNDKEQFVDAFLFLKNIEIDSDEAAKLRRERILMGYEDSAAQYLSKVLSETDVKVLRDDLKEDIHRFSMVPDLSDTSFGNNLSGVAIKYKLMGFEQMAKNKERYFSKGLKLRFTMYNTFLALKSKMQVVDFSDVDIIFTRNLPVNELETAQMVNYLVGTVSTETLLEQLDFVSDAKEEKKLVDDEKAKSYADRVASVEGIARGGGYGNGNRNFGKY
jgi:SPP1 family phage portal protein